MYIFVVCWCCAWLAVNSCVQTCALSTAVATAAVSDTAVSAVSIMLSQQFSSVYCSLYAVCVIELLHAAVSVLVDWLLAVILGFVCAQNKHTALCSAGRYTQKIHCASSQFSKVSLVNISAVLCHVSTVDCTYMRTTKVVFFVFSRQDISNSGC
jgi:hypothetical protein